MLENGRRGSCREVGVEMEIDEERRAGRNEERVLRKSLIRVREYCIQSCVCAKRERFGRGI